MGNVQRSRSDHGSAPNVEAPPRPGFLMTRPPVTQRETPEGAFSPRLSANRPFPVEPTD
jgi:hypothetical protein